MKLITLQENLKSALNQLQKAIPSKPQLPILSSVLLQAEGLNVILSGTDLYLGIRTQITADVLEKGSVAIPAEIFRQLINSLPAGRVELVVQENSILVKTEKTRATIPFLSPEEFPQFPEVIGTQVPFTLDDLQQIVEQASYAISSDVTRPVLTALLCHFFNQSLEVVGTDGFRLAIVSLPQELDVQEMKVLLPAKAIQEVYRIAQQSKQKQVVGLFDLEQKQAQFTLGSTQIYVRLIEGEYPPYERIIPTEFSYQVRFDGKTMLDELKRALFFARETSNIVRLVLNPGTIKVIARSPSYGEYVGECAIEGEVPEEMTIAFNAQYLTDFLSVQSEGEIWLGANESLKPALFKSTTNQVIKYIAMPFRVTEG